MAIERISSQSSFSLENTQTQLGSNESKQIAIQSKVGKENETKQISKDQIENIINSVNQFLQPSQTSLKFELHDQLKEYYVKVIDDRTKEVIREIPPKKLLDMYAAMMEFLGVIVDKKI
ncbi:flagellar protein FlaG [Anoxybacteroides tepidamans]|uniref:flagellar protein FlaG n=1 Tax=Anoxybacteroides tepidamans TaxID=265948 RepID=UPI000483264A|nr:flagellar protein FlaG [Anoxybacillus tepidamans]